MLFVLRLAFVVMPAELLHLVVAERRIGVRQLRAQTDPREERPPPARVGWLWLALIALTQAYPLILLTEGETRLFGLVMLLLGVIGFDLRRRGGLRWALVVLTLEGALRMGVMIQMFVLNAWYGTPHPPGLPRFWG